MADISALGTLSPVETLDLENYADQRETFVLPRKGVYTLQAPESFPAAAFSATRAGYLSAQIDPTIMGPSNVGFKLRFIKVSAKPFSRSGKTVSQMGDYLRACGIKQRLASPQELANAVEATANQMYQAVLDWRAYDKETGFSLEGMERFPLNDKGEHLPYVEVPGTTWVDEAGNPVLDANGNKQARRARAQLVVDRYIAVTN
jgi:hypothetical protein